MFKKTAQLARDGFPKIGSLLLHCNFVDQVMFSHHSDQISHLSQVSFSVLYLAPVEQLYWEVNVDRQGL